MLAFLDFLDSKQDPELLYKWVMNVSLELVVSGILLGGVVGVLVFWRKRTPVKQRAVIGAFAGFFVSIFGVVALLVIAEALKFLML